MSEEVLQKETHPIFHKDPDQWVQYMNKEVLVVTDDGSEWTGWVYTIDPVSESVALLRMQDGQTQMDIVMGHAITNITVLNADVKTHQTELERLFRPKDVLCLSNEEMEKRKNNLKSWLVKNRLPVSCSGNDDEILSISDALFIEPPYNEDSCRSTNEIILGRIQGLIKNMPADHGSW